MISTPEKHIGFGTKTGPRKRALEKDTLIEISIGKLTEDPISCPENGPDFGSRGKREKLTLGTRKKGPGGLQKLLPKTIRNP